MSRFLSFGEVLWDVFPEAEKIGGAPLNMALRLKSFGNTVSIISRVGDDRHGNSLIKYLQEHKIEYNHIQKDPKIPTGLVEVSLSDKGSATYDICYPSAWDKILFEDTITDILKESDAFIFGSLVCRDKISRDTLFLLLENAPFKILDVNLRKPHYSIPIIEKLMHKADFIKFNDDEIYEIAPALGSPYRSLEQHLDYISKYTKTDNICVTKGNHGAVLLYQGKKSYNSGFRVDVKDTVGSGDSFLGTLIHFLFKKINPQLAIDLACAVGAMVASEKGANPVLNYSDIKAFSKLNMDISL